MSLKTLLSLIILGSNYVFFLLGKNDTLSFALFDCDIMFDDLIRKWDGLCYLNMLLISYIKLIIILQYRILRNIE